jgi:hypothetical protein
MLKWYFFSFFIAQSALSESIVIKRFQMLKTPDGKHQNCQTREDYYQPGTYSIHLNSNEILDDGLIKTDLAVIGKKCLQFSGSGTLQFYYFWQELDILAPYQFFLPEGNVLVESFGHHLQVVDRSLTLLTSIPLLPQFSFSPSVEFIVDIEKGILPENLEQYERGELVSSVFYVYVESQMIWNYSWGIPLRRFVDQGPAFSLIYFIQKIKADQ